jgi:hypothetical protein
MNADGTLMRPPVWTRANAGSVCICVIPSYRRESAFPLSWSRAAHTREVGKGTPGGDTTPLRCREVRQICTRRPVTMVPCCSTRLAAIHGDGYAAQSIASPWPFVVLKPCSCYASAHKSGHVWARTESNDEQFGHYERWHCSMGCSARSAIIPRATPCTLDFHPATQARRACC